VDKKGNLRVEVKTGEEGNKGNTTTANNECAKQTIYNTIFLTTQRSIHSQSPSSDCRTPETANFTKFLKKSKLLDKRRFELMGTRKKRREFLPPGQLPFIN